MHPATVSRVKPPLVDALSVILPTPDQTWLLRACLHSGDSGREAWEMYWRRVGDPRRVMKKDRGGAKILAPLLLIALRRNGVTVDGALLTYLRTAYLREELRSTTYFRILRDVLSTLTAEGVSQIVLKGAALASTVYGDPALRHCHDINILLTEGDLIRAASILPPLGFAPSGRRFDPGPRPLTLTHESGLPLHLHGRLFCAAYYELPSTDVWVRSQIQAIAGIPTRILSPADNLLHVCVQAFYHSSRESPRWVSDAWHIMVRCPNLDWNVLLGHAIRSHVALPLSVTLRYLAEDLHAPVPEIILDRLRATASQADAIHGEAALATALAGAGLSLTSLARITGGWRPRALVLKWVVFPSPGYLRSAYHVAHSWLLPLYYVYRPLRYVARRIWWRCKGLAQRTPVEKAAMSPEANPGG